WGTIENGLVEPRLGGRTICQELSCGLVRLWLWTAGHVGHGQGLGKDGPSLPHKLRGGLVVKIETLPGDFRMRLGNPCVGQPPAMGKLPFAITCPRRGLELCLAAP